MDKLIKYQGEDFAFDLELFSDEAKTEAINIDEVAEVILVIYTDGCKAIKFSKTEKDGYRSLMRETEFKYSGIVESRDTKILAVGTINMEVKVAFETSATENNKWNIVGSASLGTLKKSMTKDEL